LKITIRHIIIPDERKVMARVCPTVESEEAKLVEEDGTSKCSECGREVDGNPEFMRHTLPSV
jgi:hypothetical protein